MGSVHEKDAPRGDPNEIVDSITEGAAMSPSFEPPSEGSPEPRHDGFWPPNLLALEILKQVRERQKDRRETDPSRTQEFIREARAGGMHGYEPAE